MRKAADFPAYMATTEFFKAEAATACRCDNCDWHGMADALLAIGDAILTPGCEVPAGRCPECETLAYVVKS